MPEVVVIFREVSEKNEQIPKGMPSESACVQHICIHGEPTFSFLRNIEFFKCFKVPVGKKAVLPVKHNAAMKDFETGGI